MKKTIIALLITSVSIMAMENDSYKEFDYQEEMSTKIKKVLKNVNDLHMQNRNSYISKENELIRKIQDNQRVKFVVKDYKKLDIFVREDYTVIEEDYVSKKPSGWRRILIKQTNIWE